MAAQNVRDWRGGGRSEQRRGVRSDTRYLGCVHKDTTADLAARRQGLSPFATGTPDALKPRTDLIDTKSKPAPKKRRRTIIPATKKAKHLVQQQLRGFFNKFGPGVKTEGSLCGDGRDATILLKFMETHWIASQVTCACV